MKQVNLLLWLTQLGLSVGLPPVGLILLAAWLRERMGWGKWVIWAGVILGLICAADGFFVCMKAMKTLSGDKRREDPPPVSFNDHH